MEPREESEIFNDLKLLCNSSGYIHALAYLCYSNNFIKYDGVITEKEMLNQYSSNHLVRTEISTLMGLMILNAIDYAIPGSEVIQLYIDRTLELLREMQASLNIPAANFFRRLDEQDKESNPFTRGDFLREAIFYGGESAYISQYRDLAVDKYEFADIWLSNHLGYSAKDGRDISIGIMRTQEKEMPKHIREFIASVPDDRTLLPCFRIDIEEVCQFTGLERTKILNFINAFSITENVNNNGFTNISEYNIINSRPIIKQGDSEYYLFHHFSLAEALYESPLYWMYEDKEFEPRVSKYRGEFAEEFCRKRLEKVFKPDNVFRGVNISKVKAEIITDIDCLVVYGNRLVVLQAKSKKMTIAAKKGNDGIISKDFQLSVQSAYDQAWLAANSLLDPDIILEDELGNRICLPCKPKEIYLICAVSDNYPALSLQVLNLLQYKSTPIIQNPMVLDIFTLDAITEFLDSPLYFLSYINRRVNYFEKVHAMHELTVLSYHLKRNLWIEDELSMIQIGDDVGISLEIAMLVRREGLPGNRTPTGILTVLDGTSIGRFLKFINDRPEAGTIEIGFFLLTLSEKTLNTLNRGIDSILQSAIQDNDSHDFSLGLGEQKAGITVHVNQRTAREAEIRLLGHCMLRKYSQKSDTWYGLCIDPHGPIPRFGVYLSSPWEFDQIMEDGLTGLVPKKKKRFTKIGRNAPCPCGSGLKYKKCCMK